MSKRQLPSLTPDAEEGNAQNSKRKSGFFHKGQINYAGVCMADAQHRDTQAYILHGYIIIGIHIRPRGMVISQAASWQQHPQCLHLLSVLGKKGVTSLCFTIPFFSC